MQKKFQDLEAEFTRLKQEFSDRKISGDDYEAALKKLRINDRQGRCWTIGAKTGKWYFYNGTNWVESNPPTLQEGKAICIYCGFENDLKSESCEYCGGGIAEGSSTCPTCGFKLSSPNQLCPECESKSQDFENTPTTLESSEAWEESEEEKPDIEFEAEDERTAWEKFTLLDSQIQEEEKAFADDGSANHVVRSFNPASVLYFMGLLGVITGIILGGFGGTTDIFAGLVASLPVFLQSVHGKLLGGMIYGLLGGIAGFVTLGLTGYLVTVFFNLLLSIFGGIKIRLEKL